MAHYTTMLYRELVAEGHEVLMISFKRQYPKLLFPGESDKDPSRDSLKIVETQYWIDSMNPLTWLRTVRKIVQYVPDVLILQWWTTFWAPIWVSIGGLYRLFSRRPLLMLAHCVLPHNANRVDPWLARLGLCCGERFITHSEEEKRRLLGLFPRADVTVMSMPLFDLWEGEATSHESARERLNLPLDVPVILFFGMIRPYKGLDDLLVALPKVLARLPRLKLVIAGEFWGEKEGYLQQVEDLGVRDSVVLDNRYIPDEEVNYYFKAADAVVLPYRRVTGSAVARLAFGQGCPVIASSVGDLEEIIRDGHNGLLVPAENPSALAGAIEHFFVDELGEPMRAVIQEDRHRFSWTVLLDMLREFEEK